MIDEELKQFIIDFMNIDEEDVQDNLFDIFILSAIEYLNNAGVTEENKKSNLYKMAVALLVSHWYDNGSVTTDVNNQPLKWSLQYILTQLQYCGD